MIYVIGPENGPYKIGKAVNPQQRLKELQVGNHQKLVIHLITPGSVKKEDEALLPPFIQDAFKKARNER